MEQCELDQTTSARRLGSPRAQVCHANDTQPVAEQQAHHICTLNSRLLLIWMLLGMRPVQELMVTSQNGFTSDSVEPAVPFW